MVWARAAPSVGSVPAPSSSKSTRSRGVTAFMISTMLVMWPEKVDRLCSMLCSSPISAYTWSNTLSVVPRLAGTCRPLCAISVSSPTVFSVTVLPPVLGPVTIRVVKSSPIHRSQGTTVSRGISGCRARTRRMCPRSFMCGRMPSMSRLRAPLANMKSRSARMLMFRPIISLCAPTWALRSARMRSISSRSFAVHCFRSLPSSTTAIGSMNSVAPVLLWSCTRPGTNWRNSCFTGIT